MKRYLALLLSALLILSTLTITVSAASVINYNFDNAAEDGVITQAEFTKTYGATLATNSAFSFVQSDGMLTASSTGLTTDTFTLPLDQTFTEGKLEFKARFKTNNVAATGGYNLMTFATGDDNGNNVELLRINSGGTSFARPQGNSDDHGWVGPSLTADDDGFYSVNIVITNEIPDSISNKDGKNFYVTVNDMNVNGTEKSSHTVKVATSLSTIRVGVSKNEASKNNESTIIFDTLSYKKFAPEVVSVSAPAGSISPKVGTINVGFNTEVDVNTIADGITFETIDGTPAPDLNITPSADKKSVAVTFGSLEITDYVLSINSNLKAEEDGAAFTAHTVNYTAVVEPLKILSVSNEGGVVMPSIGKIDLAFNNPIIDEENLLSSISFTKANGKPIPGGAVIRFGETADKVEILVGRVSKGEYVLTVSDGLKDAYGDTLDEPKTYGYIVEDDNPAMIDVSFDGLEEREYTYTEIEGLEDGVFGSTSNFVVTGVDGGLEFREPKGKSGSVYKMTNADVFTTGKISYNFVMKNVSLPTDGDNQFRINAFTSEGKTIMVSANIQNSTFNRPTGLSGWYSGDSAELTANEDGYLDFRVVFTDDIPASRWTANSSFIMYVYDNVKGGADPVLTVMYQTSNLVDIAGISFSTYRNTAGQAYERAAIVKSVQGILDLDTIPNYVMSSDAEGGNPSAENVNLVFTNTFKNITADGVSLLSGDQVIAASVDIITDEKTVKLSPADYLHYGETYTVTFPAPLQTYEFTTENYADRLSASVNGMLLEVRLVNNEADEYVIVATYKDAGGNKLGIGSNKTSGTAASIAIPTGAEKVVVNAYKVVEGCYIKASLPFERSL